jgi:hypothetical protein
LVITNIANVASDNYNTIASVDGINTESNSIKVSVSDTLRKIVKTLVKEHIHRDNERHTCKIVRVELDESSENITNLIKSVLKQSFSRVAEFSIESDYGDEFSILDCIGVTCIIKDNTILFISTKKGINLKHFIDKLDIMLNRRYEKFKLETTREILMF